MAKQHPQRWSAPVLTVEDLGRINPFFKKPFGRWLGKGLLQTLKVSEINSLHSDYSQLSGVAATSAVLNDPRIQVTYTIHGEEHLQGMGDKGAFFTVSNHPFGALDGLILIDIMARIREDFKVLVNGILNQVSILKDFWIPVMPVLDKVAHDPTKNISGLQMVRDRILGGHPVGMFPAGGLPHYDKGLRQPIEIPWKLNNIRIIKGAKIPTIPIMFGGNNSKSYFRFGERCGYGLASILIPKEILNKKGSNIDVYVGKPIMPEELEGIGNLTETRDYIMKRAFTILPSYKEALQRAK